MKTESKCLLEEKLKELSNYAGNILLSSSATDKEKETAKHLENAIDTIMALKESRNTKIWGIGKNGNLSDDEIIKHIDDEDKFLIDIFLNKKLKK